MSFGSRLRQSVWLEYVNQSLYFRVPWRRRRQIIQELKANLAIASAEVGPQEALKQVGPASELVQSYLETDRGKFDLSMALMVTICLWLAWNVFGAIVWMVAWGTQRSIQGLPAMHHTYFGLVNVTIEGGEHGSSSFMMDNPVLGISCLVAFLVSGRVWRLFHRKSVDSTGKVTV